MISDLDYSIQLFAASYFCTHAVYTIVAHCIKPGDGLNDTIFCDCSSVFREVLCMCIFLIDKIICGQGSFLSMWDGGSRSRCGFHKGVRQFV